MVMLLQPLKYEVATANYSAYKSHSACDNTTIFKSRFSNKKHTRIFMMTGRAELRPFIDEI